MAETNEKVELRKLEGSEKTQLLSEMGRTVTSRITQKIAAIEEGARLNARKVSCSKQFIADQKKLVGMVKKSVAQEKKLRKGVEKKTAPYSKKIRELEREIARIEKLDSKLWGQYNSEQRKRDQKRTKELQKTQAAMHKRFDDPMMYVDFGHSYKGTIFVKAVSADVYNMTSDHKAIQKAMDSWMAFRVKVIADPNWNGIRADFDKFVEAL